MCEANVMNAGDLHSAHEPTPLHGNSAPLSTADHVRRYVTAGRARVTLLSTTTGERFTYQISERVRVRKDGSNQSEADDGGPDYFVGLLSGPDNQADYAYLGVVWGDQAFKSTRKSRVGPEAPSRVTFEWFWRWVIADHKPELHPSLQVWHEGRCGRCGRTLTVPESIASGLGPVCAGRDS